MSGWNPARIRPTVNKVVITLSVPMETATALARYQETRGVNRSLAYSEILARGLATLPTYARSIDSDDLEMIRHAIASGQDISKLDPELVKAAKEQMKDAEAKD